MASGTALVLACLLCILVVFELGLVAFVTRPRGERTYSYVGNDVPNKFPVTPDSPPVALHIENPQAHYRVFSDDAANWQRLAPHDARVHLGPDQFKRPFTLGLFHQMKCLDVVRSAVLSADRDPAGVFNSSTVRDTRHCLNYLRQMVLCQANTRLERVTSWYIPPYSRMEQDQMCRDWRTVYEAARQNELEYQAWRRVQ